MEPANYKKLTVATDVKVFFFDPQSPWQRGANENKNSTLATGRLLTFSIR